MVKIIAPLIFTVLFFGLSVRGFVLLPDGMKDVIRAVLVVVAFYIALLFAKKLGKAIRKNKK